LIIDDEKMIRSFLAKYFKSKGYRCSLAETGTEGLAYLRSTPYDLVVLDMHLDDIAGEKLFPKIRALQENLPVIISSGYPEDGVIESILEEKNTAYMAKPFRLEEIHTLLSNLVPE
jgi:DNA-binding response OmpR family regulator